MYVNSYVRNKLDLASLCHVSKQAKIKSGKTPSDKESPKYEVSDNNFL